MSHHTHWLTLAGAAAYLVVPVFIQPAFAQDAARGALLYPQTCGRCHATDENRLGPKHNGIIGRKAGSVPDFVYSPALKAAGFTWDADKLNIWLQGPRKMVPGANMYYVMRNAQDRADIIAYLATQK